MMLPLAFCALAAQASEVRWFYPDESAIVMGVADNGDLVDGTGQKTGLTVGTTEQVVVRSTLPGSIGAHAGVAKVRPLRGDGHTLLVTAAPGVDPFVLSRALHARTDVDWAHPDLVLPLRLHAAPDDPFYPDQWYLENTGQMGGSIDTDVDAETLWTFTTGADQLVAVIDSGVDPAHPDLRVTAGWDYIGDDADSYPSDGNAHGTAVAGMVGGIANNGIGIAGIVPDSGIYGIRLIGGSTTTSDVRDAFVEAVDAGASVLNNSWGFGDGCSAYTLPGAMREGIIYAEGEGREGRGAVVVTSAGNGNCDNSGDGFLAQRFVVGVAAVDGSDQRESYSSFGDGVDITGFAGGNIVTADIVGEPGYGAWRDDLDYTGGFSGTSSAAPSVSGVIAAMFAVNPELTAAEARDALCATADRINIESAAYNAEGWGPWFGCGRIAAEAAVRMVANTAPEAPALTGPTADPWEDAVVLRWTGSDPENDPLTYIVTVEVEAAEPDEGDDESAPPPDTGGGDTGGAPEPTDPEPMVLTTTDTRWDLTGRVAVGDTVRWTVVAQDRWTESPPSAEGQFTVAGIPEEPVDTGPEEAPEETTEDPVETPDETTEDPATDPDAQSGGKMEGGSCTTAGGAAGLTWLASLLLVARRRRG